MCVCACVRACVRVCVCVCKLSAWVLFAWLWRSFPGGRRSSQQGSAFDPCCEEAFARSLSLSDVPAWTFLICWASTLFLPRILYTVHRMAIFLCIECTEYNVWDVVSHNAVHLTWPSMWQMNQKKKRSTAIWTEIIIFRFFRPEKVMEISTVFKNVV